MKKFIVIILGSLLVIGGLTWLITTKSPITTSDQVQIVTTLYPITYLTEELSAGTAEVTQIIPAGVEAHHFEPRPADIALLNNADIFIYTGDFMETWVADTIKGLDNPDLIIVRAADNTKVLGETGTPYSDMGHIDPHVWLDFDNTKVMAGNIAQALRDRTPDQSASINGRLNIINDKLDDLNKNYSEQLTKCTNRTIIFAGHYTFGYLANKYSLNYQAAQGLSPDKEPTAEEMIALIEQIKGDNIKYVFYEELTSPKIAETLARETGAQLLELNSAHNLTKEQLANGQTFFTIMTKNLDNIQAGLSCH